jgi:RNA polymerase sigma-70 factor (ECF subfamily)
MDLLIERLSVIPRFLEAINRRHGKGLSEADLDDLSQDTALRVWRKLDAFGPRATLDNWIYRFCVLEYMNRMRKASRAPRLSAAREDVPQPASEKSPAIEQLAACLDELPAVEAEVVELRHFDGLAFHEIGDRLSISVNTAKTRYYRALTRLRAKLRSAVQEEST